MITQDELYKLTDLLEDQLMALIQNPSLNSKKGRYIYYTSLLVAGELSFWRGRFAQSIAYFTIVLNEWSEAKEETFGFVTDVAASIFSLLNIMGLNEYVDLYYEKNKIAIEKEKSQYVQSLNNKDGILYDTLKGYNKMQLSKIEDRHHTNSFITLALLETLDLTKTKMYDTGLEYGDVDVSFGFYRLADNKENDTLSLYMQREENVEKKEGVVLIHNLSKIIERERLEFINIITK